MTDSAIDPTLPAGQPVDGRLFDRLPAFCAVHVEAQPLGGAAGHVTDVSISGCRLVLSEALEIGTYVTFAFDSEHEAEGWVIWSDGNQTGVEFHHPISPCTVARITGFG